MISLTARHDNESATQNLQQARRDMELDRVCGLTPPKSVSLPLAQITRLLLDASRCDRSWLRDFADDVVRIDSDLYEVLLAYQEIRGERTGS